VSALQYFVAIMMSTISTIQFFFQTQIFLRLYTWN